MKRDNQIKRQRHTIALIRKNIRTESGIVTIQLIKGFGEPIFFNFSVHFQYGRKEFGIRDDIVLVDILSKRQAKRELLQHTTPYKKKKKGK